MGDSLNWALCSLGIMGGGLRIAESKGEGELYGECTGHCFVNAYFAHGTNLRQKKGY